MDKNITFGEIKEYIHPHTTICVTDENLETVEINELEYINPKYDKCLFVGMFPEKYNSLGGVIGITVFLIVNEGA